jgi:hypothetical protein
MPTPRQDRLPPSCIAQEASALKPVWNDGFEKPDVKVRIPKKLAGRAAVMPA